LRLAECSACLILLLSVAGTVLLMVFNPTVNRAAEGDPKVKEAIKA
jgi:hypothetical protein